MLSLQMSHEQSAQLARIISEMLDISRIESGEGVAFDLQPVQVDQLVADVVHPFVDTSPQQLFQFEGMLTPPWCGQILSD
jgi:signal transduction histidine kinase